MLNTFMQPHFAFTLRRLLCDCDYECDTLYVNLIKKIVKKIQIIQNNCICFCQYIFHIFHIYSSKG